MAIGPLTVAKAVAIATAVEKITGARPKIVRREVGTPDGARQYLDVVLSEGQKADVVRWLDSGLVRAFGRPKQVQDVQVDVGGVLIPWSLRWILPMIGLSFVAGFARGRREGRK